MREKISAESGAAAKAAKQKARERTRRLIKRNWLLYLFLLPAALYIFIFHYGPMYGIQIAFRDFKPVKGIWGSPWVGMKWIQTFIDTPRFWTILKNTIVISLYSLISFPFPILLALFINNVQNMRAKKFVQTITNRGTGRHDLHVFVSQERSYQSARGVFRRFQGYVLHGKRLGISAHLRLVRHLEGHGLEFHHLRGRADGRGSGTA